jgi:hypothetical protein
MYSFSQDESIIWHRVPNGKECQNKCTVAVEARDRALMPYRRGTGRKEYHPDGTVLVCSLVRQQLNCLGVGS